MNNHRILIGPLSLVCAAWLPLQADAAGENKGGVSPSTPGWFPFVLKPTDAPAKPAMDVSWLNQTGTGRITVRDGHFVDEKGKRVRFLGVNFTFSGAFPAKEDAPVIARRLAQLGFNLVRFHHMDARDIWLPGQKGLDPEKLDRLAWFLFQLKQNGIYANINLHVSRTYPLLRKMKGLPRAFRYGKILDTFYDPFIEMQEQYAADLLGYRSPYTKLCLAEDPAVAFVELNNENTLLNLSDAVLVEMPEIFRVALRKKWRAWLSRRYGGMSDLLESWNRDAIPLGPELLQNGDFGSGLTHWTLEGQRKGVCEAYIDKDDRGRPAVLVRITQKGRVPWAYQLHQIGTPVENGKVYTIRFRAKATPARTVSVGLRFAQAPWKFVSRRHAVRLTPEWQEFRVVTGVDGIVPDIPIRLSFNMGDSPGEVGFSQISLRPGRERFDPGPVTTISGLDLPKSDWPDAATADFRRFLINLEQAYVQRMRRFLREKVGLRALVVDTQASYGGFWGLVRESTLSDYIDNHSYWQHPHFPGRPWDSRNWFIPNTPMTADEKGGTFRRLVRYRYAGMPYSISEYNHPFPNDYAAEMFPMLASFAAYQDWDAIYQFSYLNRADSAHQDRIRSYFELCHHAAQLVFAPAAAIAFRLSAVPPAPAQVTAEIPRPLLDRALEQKLPGPDDLLPESILPNPVSLSNRFAVRFVDRGETVSLPRLPEYPRTGVLIDGPVISWRPGNEQARYLVNAPAVRMAVGEIAGEAVHLGDVTLRVDPPQGRWACTTVASLDGKPIAASRRVLWSLATRVENTNMVWSDDRRTISNRWGTGPVVAQGVTAELAVQGAPPARVFALDPRGEPARPVPVRRTDGGWSIKVGPSFRTLWYIIER